MIGIASPLFCSTPFPRMAEEVAEHFDMWEVLSEGDHRLDLVRRDLLRARETLDLRFQVHVPMSDVNIGSVYEPMRIASVDEVKKVIATCRELEIGVVTVHPGFVNGIAFLDRSRPLAVTRRSIQELAPFAEEHGVVMAVENLPANINATCTRTEDLLSVVEGTTAGLCFDMGHANTAGEVDNMLRHVARFRNVHLHNNEGQWDQHNVIDEGTADLGKVASALRASYSGNIVIEATDLSQGVRSKAVLERLLHDGPAP
ncbi:MAG: sugar phosphate isomerase/epimerase family protein [Candidatus Thermoplasmatota archaeon]